MFTQKPSRPGTPTEFSATHMVYKAMHKPISEKQALNHLKIKLNAQNQTAVFEDLVPPDASNPKNGSQQMLANLREKIAYCKSKNLPYSLAIEGNFGATGEDKWIVQDVLNIMDEENLRYYPKYYIIDGGGASAAAKDAAKKLGEEHAKLHHYTFKTVMYLKAKSPEIQTRGLPEEKDDIDADSLWEAYIPGTPTPTPLTPKTPKSPDSAEVKKDPGSSSVMPTVHESPAPTPEQTSRKLSK